MTFGPAEGGGDQPSIVAKIVADASEFAAGVRGAVDKAVEDMRRLTGLTPQFSAQLRDAMSLINELALKIGGNWEKSAGFLVRGGELTQEVADKAVEALRKTGGELENVDKQAQKVDKTLRTVLKALIGISALKIGRALLNFLGDAVKLAMEFNFEQFKLEVGIRAAQRRMGEAAGTMAEWTDFIKELRNQFNIFSTKDLTAATAKVILLTRELGFNREQMELVTTASIALAEISGKTVEDAARRLALFLDTGYSRGLAQLGVQISKVTVEHFALSQGINKTWNEMSRAERAALSLNAVMQQVNPILSDAGRAAETFKGQLMSMQAAQQDAMIVLGTSLAPVTLAWERFKTFMIISIIIPIAKTTSTSLKLFTLFWSGIVAGFVGLLAFLVKIRTPFHLAIRALFDREGLKEDLEAVTKAYRDTFESMVRDLNRAFFAPGSLGDAADELGIFADAFGEMGEDMDDGADAAEAALKRVQDAMDDFQNATRDAWQDYLDDIEDATRDLQRDLEDLAIDLGRDLSDIYTDYLADRAKLIRESSTSEAEAETEARDRVKEKMDEYRLRELQDQREFNLEMEQLERRYLFDLEDAVRERDARAILDLQRKHNIGVTERTEDFEEQRRQAWENLQLELAQLRAAEQRRKVEKRNQLNNRLAELNAELVVSRQRRLLEYQRELEDLRLKDQREREDALISYNRKMRDLKIHLEDRLRAISSALVLEYKLTNQGALAIYNLLKAYYGPTGFIQQLYQSLLAGVQAMQKAIGTAPGGGGGSAGPARSFQKGGAMVARRKTPITFGEKEPELAAFIPLNRLGDVFGRLAGKAEQPTAKPDARRSGVGKAELDINIRPDARLIAETVDRSLGSMSNIMMRIRKEKVKR